MSSVIIVGFDGLQPSQVTPDRMPNLSAMAAEGAQFENHHSVFPTVTRVNVASIQTGCYPGGHGLAANNIVVRELDPTRILSLRAPDLTEVAAATGELLFAPTMGEILSANGAEFVAVGIGGVGNAFVQHPHAARVGGASIHHKFSIPEQLNEIVHSRFGPWPLGSDIDLGPSNVHLPVSDMMGHAVKVLTEYVVVEREAALSLLWCSEPDASQHDRGVGSAQAERALVDADREFGRLMKWLSDTGRNADTDVIVLSDHGYSTVAATVDIEALLESAGFPSGDRAGGVVPVPNGGAVLFYVHDRDPETADRLAGFLMSQGWCGALVAAEAVGTIEGTLPATLVGAEGRRAPDLAMSFAWDSKPSRSGYAGHIPSTNALAGDHGSLSRQEVNNVLIGRGPSFKNGVSLRTPSANTDVAPTVLKVLGLPGAEGMDGRVLEEALAGGPDESETRWVTEVHKAERATEAGSYRQSITVSYVGATQYTDEGNAVLYLR